MSRRPARQRNTTKTVPQDLLNVPGESSEPPVGVSKSSGLTESERYLEALCERNFLSFWSYPRPFRDQGGNKELCDLLVVMGDDVIVFSDKHCLFDEAAPLETGWKRWFRKAVVGGAKQAWGAERWIRAHSDRVFLDPECTQRLPVDLPHPDRARFHLVITVHGVAPVCQAVLGGTGSLILCSDVQGVEAHEQPFVLGDLDPSRSFVHVFDDATLDFVMSTLDTATDLLRYLNAKEQLLRSRIIHVAGEENLLAFYLTRLDDQGEHAFVIDTDADVVALDESWWPNFAASDERRAQVESDRISYAWDRLIERFAGHAFAGTQYFASHPELSSSEKVLRFMAAEHRLRRRFLAEGLIEAMETTPPDQRRIRVVPCQLGDEPMYVFLLFPWFDDKPEEDQRAVRRHYLEACIYVAKMKYPKALDIVGIATESGGWDRKYRSEDAFYFDARSWSAEDEAQARSYQADYGILVNERQSSKRVTEYPVAEPTGRQTLPKNPRNKPCWCGSGRKYKHCHGGP